VDAALRAELNLSALKRIKRIVACAADVRSRIKLRSALADNNLAGLHGLSIDKSYAKPLRFRISAESCRAFCLCMCHSASKIQYGEYDTGKGTGMSTFQLKLMVLGLIALIAALGFGVGYLVGSGADEPVPIVIEQGNGGY